MSDLPAGDAESEFDVQLFVSHGLSLVASLDNRKGLLKLSRVLVELQLFSASSPVYLSEFIGRGFVELGKYLL